MTTSSTPGRRSWTLALALSCGLVAGGCTTLPGESDGSDAASDPDTPVPSEPTPAPSLRVTDASEPATADEIARAVRALVSEGVATTAAFALVDDGAVVADDVAGEAPAEGWQAGSISKPVSAVGALLLADDGRLDLDAPLADLTAEPYLPADTTAADVAALTPRTVLTHTSGLPNDPLGSDRGLLHRPGEEFTYSGGGFAYLQQGVEDLTGEPFDTLMERDVLPRLGMTDSRFSIVVDGQPVVLAAASLTSTPADLARFLAEVATSTEANRSVMEQLTEPAVDVADGLRWGSGIGIYEDDDGPLYWHWGTNLGTHHALAAIDDEGDGIVLLAVGPDALDPLGDIANAALATDHGFWRDVETG